MSTDIRSLPFPGKLFHCIFILIILMFRFKFFMFFLVVPRTAVTICNNNQAVKSVVRAMATNSEDYSMIQSLCTHAVDENVRNSEDGKWAAFQKLLVKVSETVYSDLLSFLM